MVAFSLNKGVDFDYAGRLLASISKNIGYVKKLNGSRWEEAVQMIYYHALTHQNTEFKDIDPYVKNLARNILKVRNVETPYRLFGEKGELAYTFSSLKTQETADHFTGASEVMYELEGLYLQDPVNFLKLRRLYSKKGDIDPILCETSKARLKKLCHDYGSALTFRVLGEFFERKQKSECLTSAIKTVVLEEAPYNTIKDLDLRDTICTPSGQTYGISPTSFLMDIDPDIVEWAPINKSKQNILKIDITPLLDYVYPLIYAPRYRDTKLVKWCGERYSLETPGGTVRVDQNRTTYMATVRIELLLNLISKGLKGLLATSQDSIYVRQVGSFRGSIYRVKTAQGKYIDLPVSKLRNVTRNKKSY